MRVPPCRSPGPRRGPGRAPLLALGLAAGLATLAATPAALAYPGTWGREHLAPDEDEPALVTGEHATDHDQLPDEDPALVTGEQVRRQERRGVPEGRKIPHGRLRRLGQPVRVLSPLHSSVGHGVSLPGHQPVQLWAPGLRVRNIRLFRDAKDRIHLTGELTNERGPALRVPEVEGTIYDGDGTLGTRTTAYLSPGRNVLHSGETKSFDVTFIGHPDPVVAYEIEVRAR